MCVLPTVIQRTEFFVFKKYVTFVHLECKITYCMQKFVLTRPLNGC